MDEAEGLKKKDQELIVATLNVNKNSLAATGQQRNEWLQGSKRKRDTVITLISAKNIHRPQAKFRDKIDNKSCPFVPSLKEKPHSIRPLAIFMEKDDYGEDHCCHPYERELEKFEPTDEMLKKVEPIVRPFHTNLIQSTHKPFFSSFFSCQPS